MLTKGAIGNLVNRYKAVLKKCNLINTFGSLAVASMLVLGGAGVASAAAVDYADFVAGANSSKEISVAQDTTVNKDTTGSALSNYKLDVADGKNLVLNEVSGIKNVTGNGNITIDITTSTPALSDGSNITAKNLYITSFDDTETDINGRYDRVLSYVYGTNNITAKEKISFITGDHAIHTEGSNGEVNIKATDVYIKANQRPIMNSGGADVNITATNSVEFDSVGGIYNWAAEQDGNISISGKTVDLRASGSYVVQNGGNGNIEIKATDSLSITSTGSSGVAIKLVDNAGAGGNGDIILSSRGNTIVKGDIINSSKGDIVASFAGKESHLTGKVVTSGTGSTDLSFTNGATWNMTGDSTVTKISGNHTGGFNVNGEGKVLNIASSSSTALYHSGTATVGELNIDSATAAICAYGDMTITANKIDIKSSESTAIHTADDSSNVELVINFNESMKITATGETKGISNNSDGGNITIKGEEGSSFTVTADESAVLSRKGGDTVSIEADTVTIASTSKHDGNAIEALGGTVKVKAKNKLDINSGKTAINAASGTVELGSESGITTITSTSKGVILDASTLTVNGDSKITSGLYGVDARNGSKASFNGNTTINTTGDWAYGAMAWGSEVNLGSSKNDIVSISVAPGKTPDDKIGLWAYQENGKIKVTAKELNIAVTAAEGELAYGVLAQNTTYKEANTPASITIDADNTTITVASDGTTSVPVGAGIGVMSDGKVDITGNIKISAKNAILARGNASAEVNVGAAGKTVQLDGDINFNWAANSGTPVDANVNVVLDGKDSYWNGNALVTWNDMPAMSDSEKAKTLKVTGLNVALSNGAVWKPTVVEEFDTGDVATFSLRRTASTSNGSTQIGINQLDMQGGVIVLGAGVDAMADKLSGTGGSILMETTEDPADLGSFSSSSSTGTPKLTVQGMGSDGTILKAGEEGLDKDKLVAMWQAVNTGEGEATVTAIAKEGDVLGKITVSESGEGEQHDKTPEQVEPEAPAPEQPKPEQEKPAVKPDVQIERNTLMDAALQQASVTTLAIDKLLTNDVRKRLGDIRNDKNTTGVWMRWDGGKLKGDGLTNNFNTIQIGGDTKVAKNCRLGVAGSFTHGDAEFARGTAELEGFSLATYATWMGENGMFADVVARLGQFNNEMNVEGRKGKLDNRVFSLSGEYGWRFDVCDQFFIEPQAELAYTYVSSDSFSLGSANYLIDSVDSLTGRLGIAAGWNLPDDMGNFYARASVIQQFMGDAKISGMDGDIRNVQKLNGEDTWLEYGIGANVKLNDKTYIWADVERTEGADIEEEWRGTVGIRYSF